MRSQSSNTTMETGQMYDKRVDGERRKKRRERRRGGEGRGEGEETELIFYHQLPDETSLHSLVNRLEDLQANLADLSHDFSKALEIAQRGGLGGLVLEKQLEDARKEHEQNDNDMFEL